MTLISDLVKITKISRKHTKYRNNSTVYHIANISTQMKKSNTYNLNTKLINYRPSVEYVEILKMLEKIE